MLLWLVLSGLRSARPSDVARIVSAAAVWAALLIALTGVYAYRYEASDIAERIAGELFPSEPEVGQRRGGDRQSAARRRIRDHRPGQWRARDLPLRYRRLRRGADRRTTRGARGSTPPGSNIDAPVTTANGAALAAEVRLDQVAVGPIVMRNVAALVARPGALDESLLGMSFLGRLKSYAVERGRLVLTAD